MVYSNERRSVTDEDRREFLKVLGVTGSVAAGGVTLSELRDELSAESAEELAPIGEAILGDMTGALDAELLATQQEEFASRASTIPTIAEVGLSEGAVETDFTTVGEAGWPTYDHLTDVGFFESTTRHLPDFSPEYLVASVERFISSDVLGETLATVGFDASEAVDLFAAIVADRHVLSNQMWLATDKLPRDQILGGEHVPPMTKQAAGGTLLWLEDLDQHFAQSEVLLTDEIVEATTWDAHAMAAGYHVMAEGALAIAEESASFSNDELAALFTTGFALQTVTQFLVVDDGYWITEDARGPRRTDIETVTTN